MISDVCRLLLFIICSSVVTHSFAVTPAEPQPTAEQSKNRYIQVKAKYPEINYGTGPQAVLIKRGEYLARVGDCLACHTDVTGHAQPFAGGLPIGTPFGVFFSPNITPDKETGIGNWTFKNFKNALHHGVRPDGKNYFPTFPYLYYTKVTDQDLKALWAYFQAIPAIEKPNQGNKLPFPLNWRFAQYGWKTLFFYPYKGTFEYDANQSSEWNRGKYIVDGLGHCGMCHTPINYFGGPKRKHYLGGAFIEGYWAPNITEKGLESASVEEIVDVFRKGELLNKAGRISGPMADVLHDSLSYLSDEDLRAIAIYLKNVKTPVDPFEISPSNAPATLARGKEVYKKACSICHQQGIAGAPRIGDSANWVIRAQKGKETLYRNATYGYNNMPIRGACVSCTDEDVEAAVDYLIYSSLSREQLKQLSENPPVMKKATLNDGKRIYDQVCSSCHKDGRLGAPILGDKKAWEPLIAKNIDVLITNTLQGVNKNMPVKGGCKHCSTSEIIAAVKYMVQESKTSGDYELW